MIVLLNLLILSLSFFDSNAQLTSSSGSFTFCPGDRVTLTCSLSSSGHTWQLSTSTTSFILFSGQLNNALGNIMFSVTGRDQDSGNITNSTMTFTAAVDDVSNGSWVFCGGASNDMPRETFNETVNIFGRVSPPHMATLERASGDYSGLTLTYQSPLYGHECVNGYTVTWQGLRNSSNTNTIVISQLNLCREVYNFTLFAQTATVDGNEVSVINSVPDFTDLGRVSSLSVSSDGYLRWSPPPNAPNNCISGYTIQWSGSSVSTSDNATNVSVSTLISGSNNNLPFCVEVPTRVIPSVPIVPESPLNVTQNDPPAPLVYQDPDFFSPIILLSGSGSDGTGFDTVVKWQDLSLTSFGVNTTVTTGVYNGQCQATATNGGSKEIPHVCSDAGKNVSFCVVFEYAQCRKESISSRQLPSPLAPESVTVSVKDSNSITLSIDLNDINGDRCNATSLRVQVVLFLLNDVQDSRTIPYRVGTNEVTFSSLVSTTYNYLINITEGDTVIANYSNTVVIGSPSSDGVVIGVSVSVVGVAGIGGTTTIVIIVVVVIKKKKRKDDSETHELNKMEDQKSPDGHVEHLQAPTGEEYAVVEKKKPPTQPTESQALYQDPNTIEHEVAPATGDIYAVTEKKPKKKKGSQSKPTEDELSQMYSVPDKARKNAGGLTYAEIDTVGVSGKPVSLGLQTEYATVVT